MSDYISNVEELLRQFSEGEITVRELIELMEKETEFVRRVILEG